MNTIIISLILAFCITGAYYDLRYRELPNWLTYGGILAGLAIAWVPGHVTPSQSVLGLVASGGFFLILWIFHGVGAGDVKLLAAVGALAGWPDILPIVFFTALAGGLCAIIYIIWTWNGSDTAAPSDEDPATTQTGKRKVLKQRMPYAVAVAMGAALGLFLG